MSVPQWFSDAVADEVHRHELAGDGYAEDLRSPPPPPPPVPSAQRRDGAATGAVVGAVAGGVAGNVIAGRGNRTAGTVVVDVPGGRLTVEFDGTTTVLSGPAVVVAVGALTREWLAG